MSGVEMIARLICFTFGRRAQKQSVVDGGAQVDGGFHAATQVSDGDHIRNNLSVSREMASHGQSNADDATVATEVRSAVKVDYRGVQRIADSEALRRAFGGWRLGCFSHLGSSVQTSSGD